MSVAGQPRQYLNDIAKTLYKFQQEGTLCDVVIQIQGDEITAHSVILAAASPSLRELLPSRNPDSDPRKPVIQLEGYDVDVAQLWLEFVYTGQCIDPPKTAKQFSDVMSLCEALQMPKPDWDEDKMSYGSEEVTVCDSLSDINLSTSVEDLPMDPESRRESLTELVTIHGIRQVEFDEAAFVKDAVAEAILPNPDIVKLEPVESLGGKSTMVDTNAQGKGNAGNGSILFQNINTQLQSNGGLCPGRARLPSLLPHLVYSFVPNSSNVTMTTTNSSLTSGNSLAVAVCGVPQVSAVKAPVAGNKLKCRSCGGTRFVGVKTDKCVEMQTFRLNYKCLECGDEIFSLNELEPPQKRHFQKVSQRNIHTCELCGRAFGTHSGLFGHLAKHPLLMFNETTCGICKSSYASTTEFLNHVVVFGGSNRNQRSAGSSSLKLSEGNVEISGNLQKPVGRGRLGKKTTVKSEGDVSIQGNPELRMGSHKCPVCLEVFWTHASLYRHSSQHEFLHITNGSSATCGICQTVFEDVMQLAQHVTLKAGQAVFSKDSKTTDVKDGIEDNSARKTFECEYCGRTFGNKGGLQSHINMHLDGRPHKCPSCGDSFRFSKHLSSHARMFHNMFICGKCGVDCSCTLEEVKALEKTGETSKQQSRQFSCPDCLKTFCTRKSLLNHKLVHDTTRNYICEICGLSFRRADRLASHKFMHVSKPFPCRFCHKCFLSAIRLEEHTRTHTGESPLICSHCGQHFKARSALRVHLVRKHSSLHRLKVVTNKCNLCGRQFSSKAYLMLHIKWHNGKFRAYRCGTCNRGFYDAYALRKHMVVHAELRERPFLCYTCGKGFTTRGNLKTHATSHKSEKHFSCTFCQKGFKFKSNLNKHWKVHDKSMLGGIDDGYSKTDGDLEYTCEEEVVLNAE